MPIVHHREGGANEVVTSIFAAMDDADVRENRSPKSKEAERPMGRPHQT